MRRCAREGVAWPRSTWDAVDADPASERHTWWAGSDPLWWQLRHVAWDACGLNPGDGLRCTADMVLNHLRERSPLP